MKKKLKIISLVILLALSLLGLSQDNYLYQVGQAYELESEELGETRKIWVQIPEDAKSYETFPVVYVLDGGQHLGALASVHHYYWGDHMPRMVLVGISNQENRTRDLTTSKVKMNNIETGGADQFARFFINELIPYIESNFPVTSYRTLIGHSLGGLFATNMLLDHPDLFSNYIAIDPALDWDNQQILENAQKQLSQSDLSGKSLFISMASPLDRADESVGINEVRESNSEFSILARSILSFIDIAESHPQLITNWKYYPNENHGTVPLLSMIDGLCNQFEWYRLENVDKINSPETSVEDITLLFDNRSKKLRSHFGYDAPPADEEMLNMGGYMFLQMDQIEKAGFFFELAAKSYPKSANAHDSLAEYYLAVGNQNEALEELRKAYELSGNEKYKDQINQINSSRH